MWSAESNNIMGNNPVKQRIEETVFAHKLLEHGMNAKAAVMDMKPQLKEASAEQHASRMLSRVEKSGAIENLMGGVLSSWENATQKAIARANSWLESEDVRLHTMAMKYLNDLGKIVAPASSGPKTAIQNNKYILPKK